MSTRVRDRYGRCAATVGVIIAVLLALAPPGTAHASEAEMEAAVAAAINAERRARGHVALSNAGNVAYARQRARAQPDRGLDGHAGFDWETAAGGSSGAAMENLVWSEHGNGARHAVRRWMESDPHRTPILAPNADRLAVGVDCRAGQWVIVAHVVWDDYEEHAADTHGSPPPAEPRLADSGGPECSPVSQETDQTAPASSPPTEPVEQRPSPSPSQAPGPAAVQVDETVETVEDVDPAERRRAVILAALDRFCPDDGDGAASIRDRSAACVLGFEVAYLVGDGQPLNAPKVQTLQGIAAIHSG